MPYSPSRYAVQGSTRCSSSMIESTICAAAAPGAYHADVPSSSTSSPPPLAVRATIASILSSATSFRSGMPPTVVAETTGTIWSPCPPSTIAVTSFTEAPVSHAMKVEKRAVSRIPAIPKTRSFGQPEALLATWHIASSGFETTSRTASGDSVIAAAVTEPTITESPDAVLIVVSNPLDAMCHVAKNVSGWPRERVVGMAGILDTARFATFIAWETGSSVKDVTALVLGGHGDQMVSVVSATTVGGVPLRKLVSEAQIEAMVARTAKGGGELVNLMGTSAWYAPGAAAAQMVDSIMLDEKRVLPCTAYLEGEYEIDGLYMGVPCKLGPRGIEQIVELDLSDDEQEALQASAEAVREVVGVLTT